MRHGRIDANQPYIVALLRKVPGVTVAVTSDLGKGFPDIAVGYEGGTFLFEIKDPDQPPSKRRLTPAEEKWHESWTGHVLTVTTFVAILETIGAVK